MYSLVRQRALLNDWSQIQNMPMASRETLRRPWPPNSKLASLVTAVVPSSYRVAVEMTWATGSQQNWRAANRLSCGDRYGARADDCASGLRFVSRSEQKCKEDECQGDSAHRDVSILE